MLWLIGGWDNRPDPLRQCAERLQRSVQRMPSEPERYGPWGIWRAIEPEPVTGYQRELVTVDVEDIEAVERAIADVTAEGRQRTSPGLRIELARRPIRDRAPTDPVAFGYTARAGFVDKRAPFNHLALDLDDETDDRTLMAYMSALVDAWQPDHLGAVTQATMRAQGHKPPQAVVGRLTYVRDGTRLDSPMDGIDIASADGGRYLRVPGTPLEPSLEYVQRVRSALGYA